MPTAALWAAADRVGLAKPPGSVPPGSAGGAVFTHFPDADLQVWVRAFLGADPTADPSTWPGPTDLTSRLLSEPITISRGRQRGQRTASAGSATLVLDNDDGALTPLLATSTYYPDWDFGVPMQILIDGVGAAPPYSRFCGYLANIETVIVPKAGGGSTSAVRLTLGSLIRRLGQGSESLSALRRTIPVAGTAADDLLAYWPMEDGSESTGFGSALSGGTAMTVTSADFASDSTLPGSAALPVFTATTAITAPIPTTAAGTWQLLFYGKFAGGAPATRTTLMEVDVASAGTVVKWVLEADSTTVYITGLDTNGSTVFSGSGTNTHGVMFTGDWVAIDLLATNAGGMSITAAPFDESVGESINSTGPITAGYPTRVRTIASAEWVDTSMGHLAVYTGAITFVYFGQITAPNAYAGELAQDRFFRICDEDGIPVSMIDNGDSFPVGAQPVSDTLGVLRDLELPDHAILSELITTWGFGYVPMSQRYNLTPAMTIDLDIYRVTSGESGDVLTPVRNDQRIRNEWRITRTGGSSATAKDATHQASKGRYNDSDTVNVAADGQVRPEAEWRVGVGVLQVQRYATFPTDLGANNGGVDGSDDLLTDWLRLDLGARLDRISYPDQHAPDRVSLILEGYTERLRRRSWIVEINPEPYDPFNIGTYQNSPPAVLASATRYGTRTAVLAAAVDTDDTSLSVTVGAGGDFTVAAASLPGDIEVGGEQMTVTAVSGSGTQTLTVTRSINGVVKSHSAGAEVRVWSGIEGKYGL